MALALASKSLRAAWRKQTHETPVVNRVREDDQRQKNQLYKKNIKNLLAGRSLAWAGKAHAMAIMATNRQDRVGFEFIVVLVRGVG